jgi:hypothetical protein
MSKESGTKHKEVKILNRSGTSEKAHFTRSCETVRGDIRIEQKTIQDIRTEAE